MNPLARLRNGYTVAPAGCWLWHKATDPNGYGRFWLNRKMEYAHRASYQLLVGPIPEGLDLDHLCRVRNCVNPAHLEAVDRRTNLVRGNTLVRAHVNGEDCGNAKCSSCRWRRGDDDLRALSDAEFDALNRRWFHAHGTEREDMSSSRIEPGTAAGGDVARPKAGTNGHS